VARLPQPGGDNGTWGDVLNDFLSQALRPDGLIRDNAVTANTLAPNSVTNAAIASDAVNATSIADGSITNALIADGTIAEAKLASAVQAKLDNPTIADATTSTKGKVQLAGDLAGTAASPQVAKLQGIAVSGTPVTGNVLTASSTTAASWTAPPSAPVSSVAGKTGVVTLSSTDITDATTTGKAVLTAADAAAARAAIGAGTASTKMDVGLGNVDNTSDVNKPVSTAQQTALDGKTANLVPTAVTTSAYTAAVNDLIPADASSAAFTINLPTAPADKARVVVKKIDSTTNVVTLTLGGSDVFNKSGGGTTLTLSLQNQAVVLQYKASGAIWYVVSTDVPLGGLDNRYAPITQSSSRLPLNTKLRGGNITVKPSGGSWGGLWSEWDWNNWIKPQVDRAIALGLNAIRIIGAPEVVMNPAAIPAQISQATYDSHWKQLADYTAQNNMWLYPSIATEWAFHGYTGAPNNFQDATATACITTTAAALATQSNVIGFDIFQEGSGQSSGLVLADVLAMYAAIRAVAPGIPLTTSNSSGGFGSAPAFWTDTSSLQYQIHTSAGGSDFVDLHVYLDGVLPTDIDFLFNALGKPFLFGEFGDGQDQTTGAQTARYVAMAGMHNRAGILGSFLWALADQGTATTSQYGVWDNTGFAGPAFPAASTAPLSVTSGKRTNMTNILPTFNRTDTPATPYRAPNDLSPIQSRPLNLVSGNVYGWVVGANTSISAGSHGLAIAATGIGATLAGTSATNGRPPTLPSTPYVAEATFLSALTSRAVSLNIDWYDSTNTYISSSTQVFGIDSSSAPCPLTCVATSPSNAAYRAVVCRVLDVRQAAGEIHYVNDVSTRLYSGIVGATPPPLLVKNLVYVISVSATAVAVPGVRFIYKVTGTTTLTLPTAVSNTSGYVIINADASATVTIATTSTQTIPVTSLSPGESIEVVSDNANWQVTSSFGTPPGVHASTHELGGTDPIRLDQLALPTAAVAFNAQKAIGLAAGVAATDAANVGQIPSGEIMLGRAPAGALWTNLDRGNIAIGASIGAFSSGTPRGILGSLSVAKTLTGLKFLTGTTAAVTPTNWWVCITNTSGTVLAVSADQTTTAIPASTVITVPFTAPTLIPAGGFYAFIMVVAATVPTIAGVTGLLNSPAIAPVFSGNSTTTGQTTPPAIAGSIGVPTAQSASQHWCWAY
jgi:hypothetical protein